MISPLIRKAGIGAPNARADRRWRRCRCGRLQVKVGNDEIRRVPVRASSAPRDPMRGDDRGTPSSSSSPLVPSSAKASSSITTMSLPRQRVGRYAAQGGPGQVAAVAATRGTETEKREPFPSVELEADRMVQHGAQALDDGQSEPQPDLAARSDPATW